MIQNILRTLGGIDHYGLISLLFFFGLFAAMSVWALAQRRTHLERMARLPLEDDSESLEHGGPDHE